MNTMRSKTSILCALALASGTLLAAETNAVEDAEAAETNAVENAEATETSAADTAADARFARYQTILERLPFGPLPQNFDPDAPATRGAGGGAAGGGALDPAAAEAARSKEEQKLIASVRVSALNVTPSGKIAVGFTDSSKQPAANYYLRVGETRDGWTVKSADAHEMKVTLEKDGIEATLALGEGSADGKGKVGAKRGAPVPPNAGTHGAENAPVPLLLGAAKPPTPPGAGGIAALRAKRAQAAAEERQRKATAAANAEAERQEKAKRAAEEAAKQAAREAEHAAEREQLREQLKAVQEGLRREREEREQAQKAANENAEGGGEDSP